MGRAMVEGDYLNPQEIIDYCAGAIEVLKSANDYIDTDVISKINELASEEDLKGNTYRGLKSHMEDYVLVLSQIKNLNNCDVSDFTTLISAVGDEILDGAVIIPNREEAKRKYADYTEKSESLNNLGHDSLLIAPVFAAACFALAKIYSSMAQNEKTKYEYWKAKAEKYEEINDQTAELLTGTQLARGGVDYALSAMTEAYDVDTQQYMNSYGQPWRIEIQETLGVEVDKPTPEVVRVENGWLNLYDSATVTDVQGRTVQIPSGANASKWAMREDQTKINYWASKVIGDSNSVTIGSKGELLDKDGRYWIAVGPNVMNPSHSPSSAITLDEMKYGTKIDVVVKDKDGNICYIPCVVGDVKAHTYPTGIVQTGNSFPNAAESVPQCNDGSMIEFMGKGSINNLRDYEIQEIIVYEE